MKVLFIVCDGLGDRSIEELGWKTPLEAAETPVLDRLCSEGACGLMHVISPGVIPGSDTAHLALMGYDPYKYYSGRGPFEAAGIGLELREGDVALRCNFATVENGRIVDRRAGRIKEGTEKLAEALSGMSIDGVEIIFRAATEHRGVLVLRGDDLDPRITDVDPHGLTGVAEARPLAPEARKTADVVNQFTRRAMEILGRHPLNAERAERGLPPANAVLARGAGIAVSFEPFERKWGMKAAAITGVALVKGVCRTLGMDMVDVKGATGGVDTDVDAKFRAAERALRTHDLVFVNVKAPDIYGHDGDARGKVRIAERIDAALGSIELPEITVVCADHSTSACAKNHTSDPVPLLIRAPCIRRDRPERFNEIDAAGGVLSGIRGMELMNYIQDLRGKAEKFGA